MRLEGISAIGLSGLHIGRDLTFCLRASSRFAVKFHLSSELLILLESSIYVVERNEYECPSGSLSVPVGVVAPQKACACHHALVGGQRQSLFKP